MLERDENLDAISYYMDKLIGFTNQAILGILYSAAIHEEKTTYNDLEYLSRVTEASLKK